MYKRFIYLYIRPMTRIIHTGPVPHPIAAGYETHASDDNYQVVRRSGRPEWTFLLVDKGAFFFETEGRHHTGIAHHYYAIEPGVPHHYGTFESHRAEAAAGWSYWWAHVFPRPTWDPWLAWPSVAKGVRALAIPPDQWGTCTTLFQSVCTALKSGQREARQLAMAYFEVLLITGDAFHRGASAADIYDDGRIGPAVEWIESRYPQKIRLEELAQLCGMSRSTFCRQFRAATGLAPLQYLEQKRIIEAGQYLRLTHAPITEIADMLGFCDVYHFSARFKKHTGLSPLAFRRSHTPSQ